MSASVQERSRLAVISSVARARGPLEDNRPLAMTALGMLAVASIVLVVLASSTVRVGAAIALVFLAVAPIFAREATPPGRFLFATALLTLALADGGLTDGSVGEAWRPLVALVAYPLLGRALLEQVGRYRMVRESDLLVDAMLIGGAAAIFLQATIDWRFSAAEPTFSVARNALPTLLVGLDIALIVIVARALRVKPARGGPLGTFTAAAVALMTAHAVSVLAIATGIDASTAVTSLTAAALVTFGASAALVGTGPTPPFVANEAPLFSKGHATLVVISLLAPPMVLAAHAVRGVTVSAAAATGTALTAAVLGGHLVGILRERAAGEHQATHDTLTGLPNRLLFMDRLERALAHADRSNTPVGLIYIDLDRFKDVNDSLGHDAGDQLLCITASRLSGCTRHEDTLARLAGDEFGVLLPHLNEPEDVIVVAERILDALGVPVQLAKHALRNPASLGVAVYPHDGSTSAEVITAADAAMYRAKERGGGTFELCEAHPSASAEAMLETETALYNAIEDDQLVLHFQPVVSASNGRVTGAEALVRWEHPSKGLLPPGQFVPIAERSDLIVLLGAWVIEEACRELARWARAGFADRHIAVNVSSRHFRHDLVSTVTSALRSSGADPNHLVIEITETAAAEDVGLVADVLRELRSLGVRAAIDDFGTGYCGLQYLGDLPVSSLKIDRSFVQAMTPRSAAIVAATIAMGHSLGMTVVAEGIETAEQRRFLELSGCDLLQGYHLGRPMPARELMELMKSEPVEDPVDEPMDEPPSSVLGTVSGPVHLSITQTANAS